MNEIIPDGKKSKRPLNLKDTSGTLIAPDKTAEFINKFFVSIGPKLAEAFDMDWSFHGPAVTSGFDSIEITNNTTKNLVRNINTNKSSAIPNLSSKILKDAFSVLIPKLTFLFNLSVLTKRIPKTWKSTIIVPFPKDGNPEDPNNLRPNSLLPLPGKLLEKIIHQQLMEYLTLNNILDTNQDGFRKVFSTISTIAKVTDDIYTAMNNSQVTLAVFIDLKKAFDTINHNVLLRKLSYLGLSDNAVSWLRNYLCDRTQCTSANNLTSDPLHITCGVPQGSILGPLLFLCYINDISSSIINSKFNLYADDTMMYISGEDINAMKPLLQEDLDTHSNWCNENCLTINTRKTKIMTFATPQKFKNLHIPSLKIGNTQLESVPDYKYHGIMLDKSLTFTKHLTDTIKMVSHKLHLFRRGDFLLLVVVG